MQLAARALNTALIQHHAAQVPSAGGRAIIPAFTGMNTLKDNRTSLDLPACLHREISDADIESESSFASLTLVPRVGDY